MKKESPAVKDNSKVVVTKEQISTGTAGETVILNTESGMYYTLNEVGARVWNLIQEPTSFGEVRQALLDAYEVDAETCERDLQALLQDLSESGLVEID